MKFQMIHENYNVRDLQRSLTFYEDALGLKAVSYTHLTLPTT